MYSWCGPRPNSLAQPNKFTWTKMLHLEYMCLAELCRSHANLHWYIHVSNSHANLHTFEICRSSHNLGWYVFIIFLSLSNNICHAFNLWVIFCQITYAMLSTFEWYSDIKTSIGLRWRWQTIAYLPTGFPIHKMWNKKLILSHYNIMYNWDIFRLLCFNRRRL
jgi:hypothetical protein